jgi:exonuclease VII small subunit
MALTVKLDAAVVDKVVMEQIAQLERQVKTLKRKVTQRDQAIARLRGGMDVTKETRQAIQSAANDLCGLLSSAGWADYQEDE